MSTKMGFWRWALASAAVVMMAGTASARLLNDPPSVTTNEPAGIVVYPKLRVDTDICQADGNCSVSGGTCSFTAGDPDANDAACTDGGIDTIIQLTNTSDFLTRAHCLYVNTNSHCNNAPDRICTQENFRDICPAGGLCAPGWQETNFRLTLTKRQPLSWSLNDGLLMLPLSGTPGTGDPPQFNDGSIPPAPENPFMGELRCIQVDVASELPTDRNDMKGEASIVTTSGALVDARKYNAIGIPAIEGAQDGDSNTLNIGGPDAEYRGCPNILTLNHFFEGANVFSHNQAVRGRVTSEITIVPCAADFLNQDLNLARATVQFLIFNEFEQRFSTSTKVTCFKEVRLADIDTRPGPEGDAYSIFSVGVQGTLSGQSRMRSVTGPDVDGYNASTILALLEENWSTGLCENGGGGGGGSESSDPFTILFELCADDSECRTDYTCTDPGVSTTAANVQFQGTRDQGDRILIPIP